MITPWENTDVCAEHYICAISIFLFSTLSQAYYIIIYRGVSATGYGRAVLDGLNTTNKRFILHLMATVKLTGVKGYTTQMVMHSETCAADVILAQ